jgi:hypothetical protein
LIAIEGVLIGMPAGDRGLAGRHLPGPGLQHLAHDHVLHLLGRHPGALQRCLDRDPAEGGRGQSLRLPSNLPIGVRAPPTITEVMGLPLRLNARSVRLTP